MNGIFSQTTLLQMACPRLCNLTASSRDTMSSWVVPVALVMDKCLRTVPLNVHALKGQPCPAEINANMDKTYTGSLPRLPANLHPFFYPDFSFLYHFLALLSLSFLLRQPTVKICLHVTFFIPCLLLPTLRSVYT